MCIRDSTRKSLTEIIKFLKEDYNICITHGNGPQVGDELLRMDLTQNEVSPLPLGVCVAGTQDYRLYDSTNFPKYIKPREN